MNYVNTANITYGYNIRKYEIFFFTFLDNNNIHDLISSIVSNKDQIFVAAVVSAISCLGFLMQGTQQVKVR